MYGVFAGMEAWWGGSFAAGLPAPTGADEGVRLIAQGFSLNPVLTLAPTLCRDFSFLSLISIITEDL